MTTRVLLAAATAVAFAQVSAAAVSPPLVYVGDGGCGDAYLDVVNANRTHLCVWRFQPDARLSSKGCPAGYVEVGSAAAEQWVCVNV